MSGESVAWGWGDYAVGKVGDLSLGPQLHIGSWATKCMFVTSVLEARDRRVPVLSIPASRNYGFQTRYRIQWPMNRCIEHLQAKKYGQKGILWGTLLHIRASTMTRVFLARGGWLLQRWRLGRRGGRDEWDWHAWCEVYKEPIKSFL